MYKFCFYVPESHLEMVKQAAFKAGAGQIGNYDSCAWQVRGTGQFRPLQGSDAFIGSLNETETLDEYRVEMVVEKQKMPEVIRAFKAVHPYETPAYDVTEIIDL